MNFSRTTSVVVVLTLSLALVACGVSDVIAGLEVGASVLTAAASTKGLPPALASKLTKVSKVVTDITSAYDNYEKAEASLKPTKLLAVEAAIQTAQADLSGILTDASVNPELVGYITTAVAVANSAIMTLVARLPASSKRTMVMARANQKPLPTVPGAKNSSDLKKAWNAKAIETDHVEAVIQ